MKVGDKVKLFPLNLRGKNKLSRVPKGTEWVVLETRQHVVFSPRNGTWLFIAPVSEDASSSNSRWVSLEADPDFTVAQV